MALVEAASAIHRPGRTRRLVPLQHRDSSRRAQTQRHEINAFIRLRFIELHSIAGQFADVAGRHLVVQSVRTDVAEREEIRRGLESLVLDDRGLGTKGVADATVGISSDIDQLTGGVERIDRVVELAVEAGKRWTRPPKLMRMPSNSMDSDATISASSRSARAVVDESGSAGDQALVDRLVTLSVNGLQRMVRPRAGIFGHTLRQAHDGRLTLEGNSVRYTAIVLLGAIRCSQAVQALLFRGGSVLEWCDRLIASCDEMENLGDLALLAWAAGEMSHPQCSIVFERIRVLDGFQCPTTTVEAAWVLSASVAGQEHVRCKELRACQQRLRRASTTSGIFRHTTFRLRSMRSHVGCFADQVYPIQGFARFFEATGDEQSLAIATRCANRICDLQGAEGQWWWHYDVRTGETIERYPVYSVHQDAMGPMALLELRDAGGPSFDEAVQRGLRWLTNPPEIESSLIDDERFVIWRKVARAEPRKATRAIRTATTRVHPKFRMQWLDRLFRPTAIDFECRPYHLGWILYTWLRRREY